ncbi:hypothetical protein FGIG_03160 [Fasciola gigantica]|uniref:Sjoegren syndrome/scleroderma autoantigen 1 n=1 Tax=Fasciola gigantica TaxID=46835 RepID=A0A504Z548_FASGI|nr:hypothetical protein FGIG_03160 [Fasciola gigantica]
MSESSMSIINELDMLRDLSEEEKQSIAIQQKRSEKISSLMGQYLLKGWRMLDESCSKCGTILFMPRSGKKYCVACSEVDITSNLDSVPDKTTEVVDFRSLEPVTVKPALPAAVGDRATVPEQVNGRGSLLMEKPSSRTGQSSTIVMGLRGKLAWCMSCLNEAKSAEEIGQWAEAVRCLAEAADAVHKCSVPLV